MKIKLSRDFKDALVEAGAKSAALKNDRGYSRIRLGLVFANARGKKLDLGLFLNDVVRASKVHRHGGEVVMNRENMDRVEDANGVLVGWVERPKDPTKRPLYIRSREKTYKIEIDDFCVFSHYEEIRPSYVDVVDPHPLECSHPVGYQQMLFGVPVGSGKTYTQCGICRVLLNERISTSL